MKTNFASASLLLMVSMTIVNAGNYAYNLILGRWLGPTRFADLSLMVTLLLMMTFITAPLQMTAARYAAIHTADGDQKSLAGIRHWLKRIGLGGGLLLAGFFVLGSGLWQNLFATESALPFVLFGLAMPFSLLQSLERGMLQGQTRFGILAATYQVEMWSRLGIGILLVAWGMSVNGAVLGISLSFALTWFAAHRAVTGLPAAALPDQATQKALTLFAVPVVISQLGQILINNSDVLLVRRFFPAEMAGQYAALALIGRIVFFATWSVVTSMFPMVAQKHKKGEAHTHLLWLSLGIVAAISTPAILITWAWPEWVVGWLFGSQYLGIARLVWLYALATGLYALANVVVSYRLSLGAGKSTGLVIAAGAAQVLGILLFHQTLEQVVWVQVVVMASLFCILLIYWGWNQQQNTQPEKNTKKETLWNTPMQ